MRNNVDRTQVIKKALLEGGLVIAGRCTGKTKALAEIIAEDPFAIVVVGQEAQRKTIISYLMEMGLNEAMCKRRVLNPVDAGLYLNKINDKVVYVDEYFINSYRGPFFAAVGTCPLTVTIVN